MIKTLPIFAVLFLYLAGSCQGEVFAPSFRGITGTIVKRSGAPAQFTIRTAEGKSLTIQAQREARIIRDFTLSSLERFQEGDEIFATSESTGGDPVVVDRLFSLDSVLMMAAGNVSPYELQGVIVSVSPKEGLMELKTLSGLKRSIIIAGYTKVRKNLRTVTLDRFRAGDQVFCETRFKGIQKHIHPAIAALCLYDTPSYIACKIAATRGSHYRAGTVREVDPDRRLMTFDGETVRFNDATLWVMEGASRQPAALKGKRAVLFPLQENPAATAAALFDLQVAGPVLEALNAYRDLYRKGGMAPIATGRVLKTDRDRNQFIIQDSWNRTVTLRNSPGNTQFVMVKKQEKATMDDLRKGASVIIEGYPPDQAIKVLVQQ